MNKQQNKFGLIFIQSAYNTIEFSYNLIRTVLLYVVPIFSIVNTARILGNMNKKSLIEDKI